MKAIHYILICCLLGLYSCSRKECVCEITETRNYAVVGTRTESESKNYSLFNPDYGHDCEGYVVYLSDPDSLGNYPDKDTGPCSFD